MSNVFNLGKPKKLTIEVTNKLDKDIEYIRVVTGQETDEAVLMLALDLTRLLVAETAKGNKIASVDLERFHKDGVVNCFEFPWQKKE